jgi:hypothetical protein
MRNAMYVFSSLISVLFYLLTSELEQPKNYLKKKEICFSFA